MTIPETLASPPMPAPINWIQAILAATMILACYRHRQKSTDKTKENSLFYHLLYSAGPLILTIFFALVHSWSIFLSSERDREALLLCAFYSTYNLMIGLFAFVVNTALIANANRKK